MKIYNKVTVSLISIIIILSLLISMFYVIFEPIYYSTQTSYENTAGAATYGGSPSDTMSAVEYNSREVAGTKEGGSTTDYAEPAPAPDMATDDMITNQIPVEPPLKDGDTISADRKVTKTGYISLYADKPVEAYEQSLTWAEEKDGYEYSHNYYYDEQYETVSAIIKIPVDNLDEFLDYISTIGDVQYSNVVTDDITATYVDTETRLKTLESTLKSYEELLAQTTNPEEKLIILQNISQVTTEIEYLQSQMNDLNTQVEMATVNISIGIEEDPNNIVTPTEWQGISGETMLLQMKSGVIHTTNLIVNGIQRIIIVFVSLIPLMIVGVLGVVIIRLIIKRKISKKNKKKAALSTTENNV